MRHEADEESERASSTYSMNLVLRAQAGAEEARNELFGRYRALLIRNIQLKLGKKLRSRFDAEDIAQECLAEAAKKLAQFEYRGHRSFLRWLTKFALNAIRTKAEYLDALKRNSAQEVRLLADSAESSMRCGPRLASPDSSPSRRAAHAEFLEIVDDCVKELSPRYRKLVVLRDYELTDWETILSMMLYPSVEAAKVAHHRATVALKECVRRRVRPEDWSS